MTNHALIKAVGSVILLLAMLAVGLGLGTAERPARPANTPVEVVAAYAAHLKALEACRGFDECWDGDAMMQTLFEERYAALNPSRQRYVRELFTCGFKSILVCPPIEASMARATVSAPRLKSEEGAKAAVEISFDLPEAPGPEGGENIFNLILVKGEWKIIDQVRGGRSWVGRMKAVCDEGRAEGHSVEIIAASGAMGILRESMAMERGWRKGKKESGDGVKGQTEKPK